MQISLPNLTLRDYQLPGWRALEAGARRAAFVWPRRAGKDTTSLAWTAFDAHRTLGGFWHLFPEQTQARKAIWNGLDRDGKRIIDVAFPPGLREKTLDNEMFIRFKNGSTWQLGGSDRYDALVGSNPRGVVFSEFAISNPRAYEFVRPILAENNGWALFPYTPRGRNHGFDLFQKLQQDNQSFAEILTCDDTGHMSAEALALEKAEMSEELYLQEYFGSWDFGIEGAIFARQVNRAITDGRVTDVPYNEALPVWVSFDIGLHDGCGLWFFQLEPGGRPMFIEYEQARGEQLKYYVDLLKSKPYTYGNELILPHDAGHERLGMESIEDQLRDLGYPSRVLKVEKSLLPGLESARVLINRAHFDLEKCRDGLNALSSYRREYNERTHQFLPKPLHDWTDEAASSFRYAVRAINAGYCQRMSWAPVDYSALNRAAQ